MWARGIRTGDTRLQGRRANRYATTLTLALKAVNVHVTSQPLRALFSLVQCNTQGGHNCVTIPLKNPSSLFDHFVYLRPIFELGSLYYTKW